MCKFNSLNWNNTHFYWFLFQTNSAIYKRLVLWIFWHGSNFPQLSFHLGQIEHKKKSLLTSLLGIKEDLKKLSFKLINTNLLIVDSVTLWGFIFNKWKQ